MKLKTCLAIVILILSYRGFGQTFKAEKLIGEWESKEGKEIQAYKFVDASHLLIFNKPEKNGKPTGLPRRYRLENMSSSGFTLVLSLDGDTNKNHEAKDKCTWLSDNQFKTEPAIVIAGDGFKIVFNRKK